MHTTKNPRLDFERFYATTERARWSLEDDLDWGGVRADLVTADEVRVLRGSALVESYAPGYGADLLTTFAGDLQMSSFLTVQLYEEFKHFHALRRYLRCIGIEVADDELMQNRTQRVVYADPLVPLLKFGISEIFTAVAYRELGRATREPVLAGLSKLISDDEYRHLGWYVSYLEAYVAEHGVTAAQVNAALERYQHQGLDAIGGAWVEHWNFVGDRYTRLEPYRYLRHLLRNLVGPGVRLHELGTRTADAHAARTFR
jgi:hypothetical protein